MSKEWWVTEGKISGGRQPEGGIEVGYNQKQEGKQEKEKITRQEEESLA